MAQEYEHYELREITGFTTYIYCSNLPQKVRVLCLSMARAAQAHREFYVHFVVGDYDSYVESMARNTVYGTQEAEALAEVLGRRVRV